MKQEKIEKIIKRAYVCRLGILDGETPYIVPMCFGYRNNSLYFHSSLKSKKIELIKQHPNVCFELDILAQTIPAPEPCKWNMRYQSVIGFGRASMIEDDTEKKAALAIIMNQYASGTYSFPGKKVRITAVIKVDIESMTGKSSGFDGDQP